MYAASSPWTQTDWVGGSGQTSWSDATKFSSSSNLTFSTAGQLTLSATSSWYNTSWAYRRKITFDNSSQAENLTNFPVLVKLDSTRINYSNTQDSGQDIRFTDSDGTTLLSYEIEKWDETGSSFVWVKVPQIDASSSTDNIYMYYGNSSATDGQAATSVWDSNFKMIQHLKETSGTAISDSTSNGVSGTKSTASNPASSTNGQIGNALSFDGSTNIVTNSNSVGISGDATMTLSAWFKSSSVSQLATLVEFGGQSGLDVFSLFLGISGSGGISIEYNAGNGYRSATGVYTADTWNYFVAVKTPGAINSTSKMYLNGVEIASNTSSTGTPNINVTTHKLGEWSNGGYNFNGIIDEVRISNIARSAAWIAASYKSESDAFNTFNSEEERYASSGTLTSSIFDTEQQSNWGTLTYNTDGVATTTIKARTSNSSSMTGATDFTSCNAITSGTDISSNNCVTDTHRYIQYQISLTSVSANTPTFQDVSIAFTASDTTPPAISLTTLSPDPNNDNTPSLSGTATDAAGTVSNVQFQMDATSGSWTACTADDGSFNSASEAFTCTSSTLSDGSHTMYVRATDSNSNTTSDINASTDTFTINTTGVSVTLTAISPDPGTDTTPTISGSATATIGTISNVQFQVDSTTGTWTSCTASDGSFNAASENFSCTTSALSDGSHTIYVRATDNASNNSSNASDSFTVDTTNPASFDLDSPGNDSYTNSERPSFKWKASSDATAGLSKYVLEIDNPSIGSGQPSGDFTIDSIPTSRTTDYETNKYVIHYENFSDSDSTNNYISVYTKSHSDWGTSENDGKLREGRISWKVKAVDNAGNETSSSRTLFVDRSSPKVELTQINDVPFSSTNFSTTDKTPTIFGKITDSLSGGDSSQTQDENGPKVASGPKQVDIKVEKKEGIGYKLITLYTINMDKPWYTCDNREVSDNSKQKCDKYLPFEYTSKENLELGAYKITLTGKDKADNSSGETTLTLNITTLAQITTPEEKEIIEEQTKPLTPEQKEQVKEELKITKPTEVVKPTILEKTVDALTAFRDNLFKATVSLAQNITSGIGNGIAIAFNGIGQGTRFVIDTTGKALAFVGNTSGKVIAFVGHGVQTTIHITGETIAFVGRTASNAAEATGHIASALYKSTTSTLAYVGQGLANGAKVIGQGLAWTGGKIGEGVLYIAQGTGNLLASIGQGIGNTGKTIGQGYNQLANNAPSVTKTILIRIGNGVSTTTNTIASVVNTTTNATVAVASTTVKIAQSTTSTIGNAARTIATATSTVAYNTTKTIGTIANNTGNTISNVSKSIASTTTTVAQNTSKTIGNVTSLIAGTMGGIAQKTGSAIASTTQNTVKATKEGLANIAFKLGEKTEDFSNGVGTTIIKIGYLLVPEPTRIANVKVIKSTPTSMTIAWETNHPANGKVNYGLTADYGQDIQTDKRTFRHEFTVTGLKPNTTYYYEVMSQNRNYVYDANHTFTTPAENSKENKVNNPKTIKK